MKIKFRNKKISGILCVLPEQETSFDSEVQNYNFDLKQTMKLKKIMGYDRHRVVKQETSTSDLCVYGMKKLIDEGKVEIEDVCAIIVVTITPDHFVPHVSNIIQREFGFSQDVLAVDILQSCNGFLLGLMQSFMLLEYNPGKKVLLFNADTLSKKVSKQDRNSYPLIGDCATITVVENSNEENEVFCNMYMDGSRADALKIPAGGSRLPCSAETAVMHDDGNGNIRSLDNFVMDGSTVFEFVMTSVPPLIAETLDFAEVSVSSIDWYLFHQPNKFMLQKLSEKMRISKEKMPMNVVENFGNPSSASIPLVTVFNLGENLLRNKYKCCLSAFGGGLSYGAFIMDLGGLDFGEICISNC